MAKQHYALTEKEGCNQLQIAFQQPPSGHAPNNHKSRDDSVRDELEDIYRTYAELYPNPRLLEERRERETLLQASRAASAAQQTNSESTKPRRGFFTFLFGSRDASEEKGVDKKGGAGEEFEDDDRIQYIDTPNEYDDGTLCGTQQSLDVSCIPPEVYNVARSHLTSTRTRRENPNALRWGPTSRWLTQQQHRNRPNSSSVVFLVVGLGEIAEFGGHPETTSSSSRVLHTSDRDKLLGYAQRTREFDLSAVRGTILSQNCVAVSWGFLDGITVFYRRKIMRSRDHDDLIEGWEAVWWVGPSGPVLDNLTSDGQDLFHDDAEQPGSPLLKISDCVALHVEAPVTPGDDEMTQQTPPPTVAMLVVSRLGGYIEVVPLPTALWTGPILEREMAPPRKTRGRHYATGQNIVCPPNTLALTTFEYHLDVQSLDVHRTNVNSETIWNNEKYPDGPPAEFLLVASGVSVDGGYGETMTFWAISTLFAPNEEDQPSNQAYNDFQIHSRLLEAIWTSTGAPVSTFATPAIMRRWRTPRTVELKETAAVSVDEVAEDRQDSNSSSKPLARVTTLSTTAPIVSMKFSGSSSSATGSGPYLSVLDWNGGVQIFDCSIVVRLAAQNLTQHEYEQYRALHENSEQQEPAQPAFHLVKCVMLRSQIGTTLQKFAKLPSVGNFHWLESNGRASGGMLPSIVLVLSRSRKLLVVTFGLPEDNEQDSLNPSIVSVTLPASGVAIESLKENCLSFVSLRTGTSESSPNTTTHLFKYFVMEQLQPMAIVETLARESKFEEAIQSASKLSRGEQRELAEIVYSCHRHLWEEKRDIDSLIASNDELYILEEVLSICESENNQFVISLDDLRSLLKVALEIASSHEDKEERVRRAYVRLGTFELLCKFFGSKPSLRKFQKEFLNLNIVDLSTEFARRGDIPALSITLFRHRFEVSEKLLGILGSLPLAMKSSSFSHLLPVVRNENFADLFLDSSTTEDISELPWSHMPQYILDQFLVSIAFDRFDEMVVLEYNKRLDGRVNECGPSIASVVDWFVKRAKQMQAFVGHVDDVVNFTEVGMRCFSIHVDKNGVDTSISSVQELFTTWRTSLSLKRMLLDRDVSIDGDGINTDDLMGMDLVELLDLFLDCGVQSSVVRYRFDEYIQPLVMEMSISSSSDHLDDALAGYCLKEAQKCSDLKAAGAKHALASAVAIADISKASLDEKTRLIKNQKKLIHMVFDVVDEISKNLNAVETSMHERREISESIWSLYETLPARLITPDSEMDVRLRQFFDELVGIDILSRWPGCHPFKFFIRRRSGKEREDCTLREENSDVLDICNSFISAITMIANSEDQASLLQDLLCDVRNLNEVVFQNSVDLPTILCKYLIPTFLEKGYFGLVASYLGSDEKVVDRKQVIRNVIEYIDEAMFSEGDNRKRILNAIKCQDALEALLPEIQSLFQSNRRYLDASHFISTVLLDGNLETPLTPSDLKEMAALDVLETILREFPQCIGCRCSQWLDSEYAQHANKLLRQAETSTTIEERENEEMPDLPGGAVFHLATILGLESNVSALAVKSRVVYYALQGGYYGVGAAIARTLLQDQDFGSSTITEVDTIKLSVIADVVSIESYLDPCTKKELCETVLRRFDGDVSVCNTPSFNIILQVSSNLDFITSRFDQEIGILSPKRKDSLLSRPIARLYKHTFHEYKRDMHSLFRDLAKQSNDGLVHDALMDVLSKFIFYWCIHDSITTKRFVDLRYKADTQEYLKLGCGLLLQIPSTLTAKNCVQELQETAFTQAGSVASEERFEALNHFIIPNPDIMRHLIARGFTENAARRAATMTGNAGHNEAMAWAVGHATDPDLNHPLIMLKSINRKMIDEGSIQVLQKSLIQLSDIIGNPLSRSMFLHNLRSDDDSASSTHTSVDKTTSNTTPVKSKVVQTVTRKPIDRNPPKKLVENVSKPRDEHPGKETGTIQPGPALSKKNTETKRIVQQKRAPPPPPRIGSKKTATTTDPVTTKTTEPRPKGAAKMASSNPTTDRKDSKAIVAPPKPAIDRDELKRRGKAALDKLKRGVPGTPAEKEPPTRGGSSIGTRGMTPTKTVVDREALRKKGQEALNKLRNTPNTMAQSRRRLIEEGRQLFAQHSKSSGTTPRRPLRPAPTPPPRPKLLNPNAAVPTLSQSITNKPPPQPSVVPPVVPPGIREASTGKAVKIESTTTDNNEGSDGEDSGWGFDDFDDF